MDVLLAAWADYDRSVANGWTPLLLAAHQGQDGTLRRLLLAGANAEVRYSRLDADWLQEWGKQ